MKLLHHNILFIVYKYIEIFYNISEYVHKTL